MSDSLIGHGSEMYCTILGMQCIGNNVKCGVGEFAPNQFNPKVYDSNITVIGSNTVVPNNTVIGKNVVIDNYITPHDYTSLEIPSGGYLMKGGDAE
jgi:glucose-1-phosphate adenylyltransferase